MYFTLFSIVAEATKEEVFFIGSLIHLIEDTFQRAWSQYTKSSVIHNQVFLEQKFSILRTTS